MPVDIDAYSGKYLLQWEARATVRRMPRYRLPDDMSRHDLFPANLVALLDHDAVVALGRDARREILMRTTCGFMESVASLEVDLIADLCGKLVKNGMGVPLPDSTRQVALSIATDEAYHAFVAREFLGDMKRLTGIVPLETTDEIDPIQAALAHLQRTAPPAIRAEAEAMALCFAENFVTEELFGLSRDTEPSDPFHFIIREHMMDEGRHQVFFQNLLSYLWTALDEERRTALGRLLPGFLDVLLTNPTHHLNQQIDLLGVFGFDRKRATEIIHESMNAKFGAVIPPKYDLIFARNSMNLIETARILDHAPTRAAMIEGGWIAT